MARGRDRGARAPLPLSQRLVLNRWMLGLFGVERIEALTDVLGDPRLEGLDEDNVSRYHHALVAWIPDRPELPVDDLLAYDLNIVRHWQAVAGRRGLRGGPAALKHFQYLALLLTEIYLDRYFRDPSGLLAGLNAHVTAFNAGMPEQDRVEPYERERLNKLAFWMATGAGKTLLMHVNIWQYRHYLARSGREGELDHVVLLTPNEGLSRQHLEELTLSGEEAGLFSRDSRGPSAGRRVEIIDIHKLKEDAGERTIAIDAFEGNNLVLVDEGHRGSSGDEWRAKRDRLCEEGFTFEYSATFGQAVAAASRPALAQEYARCILFDYSYRHFYRDGFGKEYHILNLEDDHREEARPLYLTACLLVFYQQLRLFLDRAEAFRPYLLELPLCVFVGGSVNAVRTENKRKVSDVLDVLLFLSDFVRSRERSIERIRRLLAGDTGLRDPRGAEIFAGTFTYLTGRESSPVALFDDILGTVFNAAASASLHVEELAGTEGEIALRLGEGPPFGLINVGDAASLCKLCGERKELVTTRRELAGSLFRRLNEPDSTVKILIGSRKFTEGWNSWRVSTMGLMNVGRSEGSEIIQLFGRGVRLKGHGLCLKRSHHVPGIRPPPHIGLLETLHVFGVRADYMRQFEAYLEEEGLPASGEQTGSMPPAEELERPSAPREDRPESRTDLERNGPKPTLAPPPEPLARRPITLDWYPRIQSERSHDLRWGADVAERHEATLTAAHLAFLDLDAIYFELVRYKSERGWFDLNVPREVVPALLASPSWYRLLIPPAELTFDGYDRVRLWQEIAVTLLKKYCAAYYHRERAEPRE